MSSAMRSGSKWTNSSRTSLLMLAGPGIQFVERGLHLVGLLPLYRAAQELNLDLEASDCAPIESCSSRASSASALHAAASRSRASARASR